MKRLFISAFLIFSLIGQSQVVDIAIADFTRLKCEGPIPEEFLKLSTEKYLEDYKNNEDKALDKEFFITSRFVIDELVLRGKVLFNDPVSNYVNKVAGNLLKNNPELRNELRFYVVKSNTVNAFATDQGIVFVSLGLFERLENEAQLAFVLSHEITHYVKKHVRKGYVFNEEIEKEKDLLRDKKVFEMNRYSRENELEADKEGLKLFLKAGYSFGEAKGVLNMLLESDFPLSKQKFDVTYFNTDVMYIPEENFTDSVVQPNLESDYNDSLLSHPNVKKRISAIEELFTNLGTSSGEKLFILSKQEFEKAKMLARLEGINIGLQYGDYLVNIYNIYNLQKEIGNTKFLEISLAKAIYGMAKYFLHNNKYSVIPDKEWMKGEIYPLYIFFKEMDKKQMGVLAYRKIYDLMKKYPEESILKLYEEDLLKELALNSGLDVTKDLLTISYQEYYDEQVGHLQNINVEDSIAKIEVSDLSKYKKRKLIRAVKKLSKGSLEKKIAKEYYKTALYDLMKNQTFLDRIDKIIQEHEQEEQGVTNIADNNFKANEFVVVEPYVADFSLKNKVKRVKSEMFKLKFIEMFSKNYPKIDVTNHVLSNKQLTAQDVEKYNELSLLNVWVSEVIYNSDLNTTFYTSTHEEIQLLAKKYNTPHFLVPGVLKFRSRTRLNMNHYYLLAYSVLTLAPLPILLYDLIPTHNYIKFYGIVLNAEKDEIEYSQINFEAVTGTKVTVESYVYTLLWEITK
tara:strand:+ start:107601 stop:109814 length:2214 start_codon:yes stop_codon:yes gene_type:complete